jgi:hypothetical protein
MVGEHEHDVPSPDELRRGAVQAEEAALRGDLGRITRDLLTAAVDQAGRITFPREKLDEVAERSVYVREEDGQLVLTIAEDPVAEEVQAILDAPGEWIATKTGRATRPTGAGGRFSGEVTYVEETAPGEWGEPQTATPQAFLREHVLAAGVPLLG